MVGELFAFDAKSGASEPPFTAGLVPRTAAVSEAPTATRAVHSAPTNLRSTSKGRLGPVGIIVVSLIVLTVFVLFVGGMLWLLLEATGP
jgi:hypothetical protein